MSELEKSINGDLYNASDKELQNLRSKCKLLCFEYNNTSPLDIDKKRKIIDENPLTWSSLHSVS